MEVIKLQNVSSEMVPPNTTTEADFRLTVSTANATFSAGNLGATAKYVMLQVQTAPVWVTYDGSTPTSTNGFVIGVNEKTVVQRALALRMIFVRASGVDGAVMAQPFNALAA